MALEPGKKKTLDAEKLLGYALRMLGRRALSAGELRRKLEARAERAEHVRQVLERLRAYGYLDDRKFAEAYTSARLENQGLGKQRVMRDLRRRRVAPALARETVDRVYSGADEVALIEEYLRRKLRAAHPAEHLADPKRLASAYRRLRMAGFSAGNVIRVLKRHAADAGALESLEESGEEEPPGETPSD